MNFKIFGREPALWVAMASGALSLIVTFNVGLSTDQAGAIVAVIGAFFQAVIALLTRPIAPAAFTGLVLVIVSLLASFHFNVAPETVGALNAPVLAFLVFVMRGQVSPTTLPPVKAPGGDGGGA